MLPVSIAKAGIAYNVITISNMWNIGRNFMYKKI